MSVRLYQINVVCGVGSTGRIASSIAKLVIEAGGACRIAYGAENAPADLAPISIKVGSWFERKLHGAIIRFFDMDGYGSYFATRRLIADIESFSPSVIHLHNIHGGYINIGLLFRYLAKKNVPVVWTLHDCWAFTGHCAHFEYVGCEKWQDCCKSCEQKREYPNCYGISGAKRNYLHKKRLFQSVKRMTLTPCSDWLGCEAAKSFLGKYPIRTVHNGIDLTVFHPVSSDIRARYGIDERKLVLAAASNWTERKGLSHLIEAARLLGEGFRVVIIGLDDEQLAALPDNVLGIARTGSAGELAAWYTTADVFADPTLEDNMPLVLLEALACGTPVAVYDTGGCRECFDETCGTLIDEKTPQALTRAIRELAPRKAELTVSCLAYAARFDERKAYAKYLEIYEEVSD